MKKQKSSARLQEIYLSKVEFGFEYAVIHPDNAEYLAMGMCDPHDSDMECETLEQAISWIQNY